MATEQSITQAIMQAVIEPAKAPIMAVREAENPVKDVRTIHTVPRSGGPVLRQPMFDWKVDNYHELHNFKMGLMNIFVTSNY